MFTGIIEAVGRVEAVDDLGGGRRLTLRAPFAAALRVDESVSVLGACQTVVAQTDETFAVVAVEETLRKTTLGRLRPGDPVNLERALRLPARLDGHLVQGHVDGVGRVERVTPEATSRRYRVAYPAAFRPYLIPVGSVAVDGVSLTVARLDDDAFEVAIIPHTLEHTAIEATWTPGADVNLEFDLLGKYVVRWMQVNGDPPAPRHP